MAVFSHWPNRITAMRFVGALILFAMFAVYGDTQPSEIHTVRTVLCIAFWLFVVTAASDFLDGYLARRDHLVTAFGRIADPFTDKVLILGTMIFLAVMPWSRERLPAWMVVIIMAREFLVTGIRGYAESQGREFPADRFGKIKMIVQSCAVGGLIWIEAFAWGARWLRFWSGLVEVLVWTTLVATVGSGFSYVTKARTLFTEESK